MLKCINSAAFGIRREIQSIRQALVLLGLGQVRTWASVWALAGLNQGGNPELVTMAILRARSCELLAQSKMGTDEAAEYFLLGLCSLLDAILCKPMADALEGLPVSANVRDALLDAVIAYEGGEWDTANEYVEDAGIAAVRLPLAYEDALKWARELTLTARAA